MKIGGRSQGDPRLAPALAAAAQAGSDAVCVIHGGGDEVSAVQRRLGLEPLFVGGRRVTSTEDLEVVRMVLSGTINKRLVASLLGEGVRAVGISGEDAMLITAHATDATTMGRVGGELTVDPAIVLQLLAGGYVPVISPLARDADDRAGSGLNVNGDDAAAALAVALEADELLLVADVPGVLDGASLISSLGVERAGSLIASGIAAGGMAAKLEAAVTALAGGVAIVRIVGLDGIGDLTAGTRIVLSPSPV